MEKVLDARTREKQITRTSVIGIIANVLLSGFKAFVGMVSGSIAIVLDAVNNLTDAMSSIITIVGIKLAKRKPDNDHPYGHGRIEYFSAIIISGIVLTAGITSMIESVKKIAEPEMPDYSTVTLIVVAVAVVVKLILGRFVKSQGEKYNSDALVASGKDASFDAIVSASTLVGAAVTIIFEITVDGFVGAIIAAFIIKAGVEMLLESVSSVMGKRPNSETTIAIKKAVSETEGVIGAYDLILHNYGPDTAIGSVHVEVPASLTAEDLHKLSKRIQLKVFEQFHVFITVGFYAVDDIHAEQRAQIHDFAVAHNGVLGTHGVFIDDDMKYVSFDVVADFNVRDLEELREDVAEHVVEMLPGYRVDISFDRNYSD